MQQADMRASAARILRFGIVGVAATLTHALLLWAMVSFGGLRPSLATLIAFIGAFCVSYLGHYHFTFRSAEPHAAALPAFAFTAITGALLNLIIFVLMTDVFRTNYWFAFAATVVLVPPVVYILSKGLAFAPEKRPPADGANWKNWIVPALLFAATAVYTLLFHFQIPYYDHWDIVPLYEAAQAGTLRPADLFAQHGSHWHATGYVIMLATAEMTGMALWPDVVINLLLAAFGFCALANIVGRVARDFGAARYLPLALALAAFIHFSPDQAANFLWGWQVALFASMAGVLWAIDLLSRPGLSLLRTIAAALAAVIAVYGFATAWVLLPIGLVLILAAPETRLPAKLASLALWAGVFAALFWHFLLTRTGYGEAMANTAPLTETALGITHYVANFLGSAVARISRPGAPYVAAAATLLFLILTGIVLSRGWKALSAARGLLALAAFAVGAGILTALGRWAEFGPDQAFANRYITLSNNAWLSLVVLGLCLSARWTGALKLTALAGLCLFVGAKTLNDASALNTARLATDVNARGAALACSYPEIPEETRALIAAPSQDLEAQLAILQAHEANLFRPARTRHCPAT
ncbi:GtrA family protein [Hyphomonas sp. WL0036]|uniref:GtrA family protein n=1 Tax=Hyphomonas sediminis TaxID=2866160 RepID=UPI001C806853|nr:GtrA family protein [Hyphomonas sediminis]MBY9066680.1 GtrA family protein [Hyphomonas sediminis]